MPQYPYLYYDLNDSICLRVDPEGIRDGKRQRTMGHTLSSTTTAKTDDKQTYGKVEGARATKQITMACKHALAANESWTF